MTYRRALAFAVIATPLVLVSPGAGESRNAPARQPGISSVDRRVPVDPQSPPWNAIARLQTNIATRCTGALIAAATVLTAAHCLYIRRTRGFLQAGSLHVLFGYERGSYRWHGRVARYAVGNGFDGSDPARHPGSDWALLKLDAAAPSVIRPVPMASGAIDPGTAIALPGYSRDRAQLLMADLSCRIIGSAVIHGEPLLAHDCSATLGASGGPLLAEREGRWQVVAINIAAGAGANIAVPAAAIADR